ncbi:hypothetical protein B840_13040 (plasmid) [Corynebacterium marinum DSM 44953]|nr:hypothetical protein B840_13040 [Corynebacterium marinum DSM 44953]GGO22397.1 hypothetical protein GCM10010980_24440 [Corynebacterium marinum]
MQEAFHDGEEPTTMFTLRMNSDLHRRLKLRAVTEGRPMKEILEDLLRTYLDENKS